MALDEIEKWKSVSEPYWNEDAGGLFARIDYEGQNLEAGVIYEGLIKVPTAPIINAHGTQIGSTNPTGYCTLHKSWLESFGCTFPLEIKVHLQDEYANVKDTVTRTIEEVIAPSWKSVSEPYWDGDLIKIEYEGQGLIAGVVYQGMAHIKDDPGNYGSGTTITSGSPTGHVSLYKPLVGQTAVVELQSAEGVLDSVEKTIPEPPGPDESWKSVSEPYWEDYWIKVDCVVQNCEASKSYHARICCEGASPTDIIGSNKLLPDGAAERSCTVKVGRVAVENNCGSIPIDVDIVLTEGWAEKDRVTRTIPEPPITCTSPTPHYPFPNGGCKLLIAYDFRADGDIDAGELGKAKDDQVAGIITQGELDFIKQASVSGSINALCPGCYIPERAKFEFVEDECYIQYGDDLFCFADEPKDVPPGTNIWVYFGVKNTGETAARATVKVFDGDTKMCEKTSSAAIQPGSHMNFYRFCFKMSEANRDLVMKVYEYGKTEEHDSFGC
ncbi:MAG: hypothetical protein U9R01_00610 [candidate division WOR-3 bacterium]|nr:hypothetical protein [candidate division WOR-3 bacterium]